jgi:putative ABC transport system permease protein
VITMRDWGAPYRAQVIGIVGNVRQGGPEATVRPAAYYPLAQFPEVTLRESIVVRTSGPGQHVLGAAREQLWKVDPNQPIAAVRSMEDAVRMATADRRFNLALVAVFAAGAFALAGIGVYGVVGFAVRQRTHEIAVRLALGARPSEVIRLTLTQAAVPVGLGIATGLAATPLVARALGGFLFGVRPGDPLTLIGVTLCICGLAAAASLMPARDALAVDPAVALRSE